MVFDPVPNPTTFSPIHGGADDAPDVPHGDADGVLTDNDFTLLLESIANPMSPTRASIPIMNTETIMTTPVFEISSKIKKEIADKYPSWRMIPSATSDVTSSSFLRSPSFLSPDEEGAIQGRHGFLFKNCTVWKKKGHIRHVTVRFLK